MAVEIVVTDRIRNTIEETLDKKDIPSALRKKLLSHKKRMQNGIAEVEIDDEKELVAFSLLRELWEFLRQSKSPGEGIVEKHIDIHCKYVYSKFDRYLITLDFIKQ